MLTEYWPIDKSFTLIHFFVKNYDQMNRLIAWIFYGVPLFSYDIFDTVLKIWNWIRTIWQFKFTIPCSNCYFWLIVFLLFSYIFPNVINSSILSTMFTWTLEVQFYDKVSTNLSGSFVLLFSVFMYIVSMLIF